MAAAGRRTFTTAMAAFALLSAACLAGEEPLPGPRRPTAATCNADGRMLVLHAGGTLQRVEPLSGKLLDETRLAGAFVAGAFAVDGRQAVAVEPAASATRPGGLVRIDLTGARPRVVGRVEISSFPHGTALRPDGRQAAVGGVWGRDITLVDLPDDPAAPPRLRNVISLNFPAGEIHWRPDGSRLVVADRFAGRIAVVDPTAGRVVVTHTFPGHNLRGLAWSRDASRLLIAHQILDERSPTGISEVRGGVLMQNVLRRVAWDVLADGRPRQDLGEVLALGRIGSGAADPGAILVDADDRIWALATGARQLHVLHDDGGELERLETGPRPVALLPAGDGEHLVVLNRDDDTWTLFTRDPIRRRRAFSFGPTAEPSAAARGESLFFDGRLSNESWLSCHSCHSEGFTTGQLADTQGDDSFGTPKRILPLLGTSLNAPWGWLGNQPDLYRQSEKSVDTSMHGPELSRSQSSDLAAYLQTLTVAPPRRPVAESPTDAVLLARGKELFANRCASCHVPPLTFAGFDNVDVGLRDEAGTVKFNPPSLRGISQQERFLHDGRARSLKAVLTDVAHPDGERLPPADVDALVRYLESL